MVVLNGCEFSIQVIAVPPEMASATSNKDRWDFHIDRCCVFGNHASGAIWCAFNALVLWIGVHMRELNGLLHYVDDVCSFEPNEHLAFYEPYQDFYPVKQVELLELFDEVGIPQEKRKQEFGRTLTIIGLEVSLESMSMSMPREKREDLIEAIKNFLNGLECHHALRDWQCLLGYCNWALNAYPLLRPALQSSYAKIRGKKIPLAPIRVNKHVTEHLSWFANRISTSNGVYFFEARGWLEAEVDLTLITDASQTGLAFGTPELDVALVATIEESEVHYGDIFFNEALAVMSALEWAANLPNRPQRILIQSDSMNTVDIFNTLAPEPNLTPLMMRAVEVMMEKGVDVHVIHIPGVENVVADALSRSLFNTARGIRPNLKILMFKPPRDELGARKETSRLQSKLSR